MSPNLSSYCVLALLLCGWVPGPLRGQAPSRAPDTTVDAMAFVCDWHPRPPLPKRVVVDLLLESGNFNRTPNAEDIRAVRAVGGRVLYQFRVALLRAELDTGALRALSTGPAAIVDAAYIVTDASRFDADLQVFYTRPITDADEAAMRHLGASNLWRNPTSYPHVLQIRAADSLIARITEVPGVQFVRALAVACACTQELGIHYTPAETTLVVGQTFTPSVALSSCGGRERLTDVFDWQVEDEAVASVDRASGRVTARAPGETAVVATGAHYGRLGGVRLVVKAAAR